MEFIPRRDRNEAQDCVYPPFNAITWNSIPRRDRNEAGNCPLRAAISFKIMY
ncbi:hypothetical protein [Nostoc sp.]|uniref:hypothetical protein n=1 Tax=Nostoc sp. TaxID=1180 RepID=UPI002D792245|nr:hypothetical protein [Nostoc sp.]